jgi:hypothetical protein
MEVDRWDVRQIRSLVLEVRQKHFRRRVEAREGKVDPLPRRTNGLKAVRRVNDFLVDGFEDNMKVTALRNRAIRS